MDRPDWDDLNEVAESLLKSGTRYRTEKLVVLGVYGVVAIFSLVWGLGGFDFGPAMKAEFTSHPPGDVEAQQFVLENVGSTTWHDVRVVLNDRYLATVPKIEAGNEVEMGPSDFEYFYFIPRPWHDAPWESVAEGTPRSRRFITGMKVEGVRLRSREGPIEVDLKRGS